MARTVRPPVGARKGPTLGELFTELGLAPVDVASKSGLGLTTVYALIGGKAKARRSTVRLLAFATGRPESEIEDACARSARDAA